jgi:integral membrane protein
MKPQKLYRIVADIEAVTWALLILGMLFKYAFDVTEVGVKIAGPVHGLAFITFVVVTALVWTNNRWSVGRGLLGLLSAVIPFCTIPFERSAARNGDLDGTWRTDAGAGSADARPGPRGTLTGRPKMTVSRRHSPLNGPR